MTKEKQQKRSDDRITRSQPDHNLTDESQVRKREDPG